MPVDAEGKVTGPTPVTITGPPDDGKHRRLDVCPGCGGERWELGNGTPAFFCCACGKATRGPNTKAPEREPETITLFGDDRNSHVMVTDGRRLYGHDDFERPPDDESQFTPYGEEGP